MSLHTHLMAFLPFSGFSLVSVNWGQKRHINNQEFLHTAATLNAPQATRTSTYVGLPVSSMMTKVLRVFGSKLISSGAPGSRLRLKRPVKVV